MRRRNSLAISGLSAVRAAVLAAADLGAGRLHQQIEVVGRSMEAMAKRYEQYLETLDRRLQAKMGK